MPNNPTSSANIAIRVSSLTKIYHLYDKPQDRLKEALNPFKKSYHHDFYAINDVSFEIKKGETVGIIGKNGAGKSTLLKMITGVLTPSSGSIEVCGKIASLLELGAGFNPEMTGLENIYLNGTLMGFSNEEMATKVDAILEFADIGEFIYQPVKMYSSGMFARLAFSVAINVEPEILIVDEVLSVGDIRFQQKSLRKMKDMQDKGLTILFVAHDMGVVNTFCSKVIWINDGTLIEEGNTDSVSKKYISFMAYGSVTEIINSKNSIDEQNNAVNNLSVNDNLIWTIPTNHDSFGEEGAEITGVSLSDDFGTTISKLSIAKKVNFYIKFRAFQDLHSVGLGIVLKNRLSNSIFTINSYMYDNSIDVVEKGSQYITCISFDFPYLSKGEYTISVALSEGTQLSHIQHHWIHDIYHISYLSEDKTNDVAAILAFEKNTIHISNERLI